MSPNGRNSSHKLKILYLYKILTEYTDENHGLTMPEIIAHLDDYGINAARKALYDDIEALKLFGLDIIDGKGRNADYRVLNREFELPELKLLSDAVSSSKFLTEKKANQLLSKITGLCSIHQARQLKRNVYVLGRERSMNENIFINADAIHRGINEKKKIHFRYFTYDTHKRRVYRDTVKVVSPYALAWDDNKYYMIGYYEERGTVTNFRVDRMDEVIVTDEPIIPSDVSFNMATYMESTFSMFAGDLTDIKLLVDNSLVGVVFDRFGRDTNLIPYDHDHFTINVRVRTAPTFYGWIFQFGGKIRILSPTSVTEEYMRMISSSAAAINSTIPPTNKTKLTTDHAHNQR